MKYHSGPPPSIGWWPTSVIGYLFYRWWNGKYWSCGVLGDAPMSRVKEMASRESLIYPAAIQWAHRPKSWPKRSRT